MLSPEAAKFLTANSTNITVRLGFVPAKETRQLQNGSDAGSIVIRAVEDAVAISGPLPAPLPCGPYGRKEGSPAFQLGSLRE